MGATEGELHLNNVGSRTDPEYELEWEIDTMPQAVAPGEPAPESTRISLSGMTVAAMLKIVFAERVAVRVRREATIDHWHAILLEGTGLFFAGPQDEKLLRALVRNEHDVRGQLFIKELLEVDDYRVIWTQSLAAHTKVPDGEQIDLTDLSVPNAVGTILNAK